MCEAPTERPKIAVRITSNIVPIYKKGNKKEALNYRPVSLTCIVCKLMESIIRDKIMEHFLLWGTLVTNNMVL